MKKKNAIWIYAGLIGCVLGFAGCGFISGLLGQDADEPGGGDEEPEDGGGSPPVPKAEVPVADPGASNNAYTTAQNVILTTETDGAVIYYTVDGEDPTTASAAYDADTPVPVSPGATLKAVAVKAGLAASDVTAITYMDATRF
jgi:hypothetical protein